MAYLLTCLLGVTFSTRAGNALGRTDTVSLSCFPWRFKILLRGHSSFPLGKQGLGELGECLPRKVDGYSLHTVASSCILGIPRKSDFMVTPAYECKHPRTPSVSCHLIRTREMGSRLFCFMACSGGKTSKSFTRSRIDIQKWRKADPGDQGHGISRDNNEAMWF